MIILSQEEKDKVLEVASDLGVSYEDLYDLINFESGFDPKAENPYSSARGLIQFLDKTARDLGFDDSLHLIESHPTIIDQMQIVYEYLVDYYPFKSRQALFMSVFYPAYRNSDPDTVFPDYIVSKNPGIVTIQDYMDKVDAKKKLKK